MDGLLSKATEALTKNVAGIAGTKKPEAKVTLVGLKDVNLQFVTYNSKISVTNPYPTHIPIFQVTYSLKSSDRELVSGSSQELEPLKVNQTIELELEMKVSFTLLLSLARDFCRRKKNIAQFHKDS